jgi:hypothetical protein
MDWLFPMLLGAVLVIPVWQMIDLAWYRWRGTRVMGKVVELDKNDESERSPTYAPVIEYRVGSEKCQIRPQVHIAPSLYRVGQEVPIYFFPDNPRNARLVTPREFFKWSIPALIVAGLLLIILCGSSKART